jgi:hypothetical protein
MYLLHNGDWNNPEIEISGSSDTLVKLGETFNGLDKSLEIKASFKKSQFYSHCLGYLVLNLMNEGNDLLTIKVINNNLIFSGTLKAFKNLGQSLINFFEENPKEGKHFHLDYYEGNQVLAQTNCHLIFMCSK